MYQKCEYCSREILGCISTERKSHWDSCTTRTGTSVDGFFSFLDLRNQPDKCAKPLCLSDGCASYWMRRESLERDRQQEREAGRTGRERRGFFSETDFQKRLIPTDSSEETSEFLETIVLDDVSSNHSLEAEWLEACQIVKRPEVGIIYQEATQEDSLMENTKPREAALSSADSDLQGISSEENPLIQQDSWGLKLPPAPEEESVQNYRSVAIVDSDLSNDIGAEGLKVSITEGKSTKSEWSCNLVSNANDWLWDSFKAFLKTKYLTSTLLSLTDDYLPIFHKPLILGLSHETARVMEPDIIPETQSCPETEDVLEASKMQLEGDQEGWDGDGDDESVASSIIRSPKRAYIGRSTTQSQLTGKFPIDLPVRSEESEQNHAMMLNMFVEPSVLTHSCSKDEATCTQSQIYDSPQQRVYPLPGFENSFNPRIQMNSCFYWGDQGLSYSKAGPTTRRSHDGHKGFQESDDDSTLSQEKKCPYGAIGDNRPKHKQRDEFPLPTRSCFEYDSDDEEYTSQYSSEDEDDSYQTSEVFVLEDNSPIC